MVDKNKLIDPNEELGLDEVEDYNSTISDEESVPSEISESSAPVIETVEPDSGITPEDPTFAGMATETALENMSALPKVALGVATGIPSAINKTAEAIEKEKESNTFLRNIPIFSDVAATGSIMTKALFDATSKVFSDDPKDIEEVDRAIEGARKALPAITGTAIGGAVLSATGAVTLPAILVASVGAAGANKFTELASELSKKFSNQPNDVDKYSYYGKKLTAEGVGEVISDVFTFGLVKGLGELSGFLGRAGHSVKDAVFAKQDIAGQIAQKTKKIIPLDDSSIDKIFETTDDLKRFATRPTWTNIVDRVDTKSPARLKVREQIVRIIKGDKETGTIGLKNQIGTNIDNIVTKSKGIRYSDIQDDLLDIEKGLVRQSAKENVYSLFDDYKTSLFKDVPSTSLTKYKNFLISKQKAKLLLDDLRESGTENLAESMAKHRKAINKITEQLNIYSKQSGKISEIIKAEKALSKHERALRSARNDITRIKKAKELVAKEVNLKEMGFPSHYIDSEGKLIIPANYLRDVQQDLAHVAVNWAKDPEKGVFAKEALKIERRLSDKIGNTVLETNSDDYQRFLKLNQSYKDLVTIEGNISPAQEFAQNYEKSRLYERTSAIVTADRRTGANLNVFGKIMVNPETKVWREVDDLVKLYGGEPQNPFFRQVFSNVRHLEKFYELIANPKAIKTNTVVLAMDEIVEMKEQVEDFFNEGKLKEAEYDASMETLEKYEYEVMSLSEMVEQAKLANGSKEEGRIKSIIKKTLVTNDSAYAIQDEKPNNSFARGLTVVDGKIYDDAEAREYLSRISQDSSLSKKAKFTLTNEFNKTRKVVQPPQEQDNYNDITPIETYKELKLTTNPKEIAKSSQMENVLARNRNIK